MTTEMAYCRHCEEQIENCLAGAHEEGAMRAYFLTMAWRWTLLARDLETLQACGPDCPLIKTCASAREPHAPAHEVAPGLTVIAAEASRPA